MGQPAYGGDRPLAVGGTARIGDPRPSSLSGDTPVPLSLGDHSTGQAACTVVAGDGHVVGGLVMFAAGELIGVGILARLYVLCQPSLRQLAWFVRVEAMGARRQCLGASAARGAAFVAADQGPVRLVGCRLRSSLTEPHAGWLGRSCGRLITWSGCKCSDDRNSCAVPSFRTTT